MSWGRNARFWFFERRLHCTFSSLLSRCLSLSRCSLIPAGLSRGLACTFRQNNTLNLGSWGLTRLSPKCEISKEAWSLGDKNLNSLTPRPVPCLTHLSLHHPPLSVCMFRAPDHVQSDTALREQKEERPPDPYMRWARQQTGYLCHRADHRAGFQGSRVQKENVSTTFPGYL